VLLVVQLVVVLLLLLLLLLLLFSAVTLFSLRMVEEAREEVREGGREQVGEGGETVIFLLPAAARTLRF